MMDDRLSPSVQRAIFGRLVLLSLMPLISSGFHTLKVSRVAKFFHGGDLPDVVVAFGEHFGFIVAFVAVFVEVLRGAG